MPRPPPTRVPALYAAGAIAVVVGAKGRRDVPVEQIPAGPGRTTLAKDEFILEFKFPVRPARSSDAYLRFIPRTEMDIAVVGCGISVTLDEKGVCTAARCSLGAVAPTVLLVKDMADALIGHTLDDATLAKLDAARAGGMQTHHRQARNDRISHQSGRRSGPPRGENRVRSRLRQNCKGSLTHGKNIRLHHDQRRIGRISL